MTEKAKQLGRKKIKSSFLEGITLHEYFAAMAMQGLIACANTEGSTAFFAQEAVKYADSLLEELTNDDKE